MVTTKIEHYDIVNICFAEKVNKNRWITPGIRISCNHKKYLYLLSRDNNDINLKRYYKQYCKILERVIKEAKRSMYNNQVVNSGNKMKTTWNFIKAETNRIKGHMSNKYQNSPEAFNKYFLSAAGEIIQDIKNNNVKVLIIMKTQNTICLNYFKIPSLI
jgi:DNA modification methylase